MQTSTVESLLDTLYTMNFTVDSKLCISDATEKLKQYVPDIEGRNLLDLFKCHRPKGIKKYSDLLENEDNLFLLVAQDRSIALRLKVVNLPRQRKLRLVGCPWLAWMNEHNPEAKLQLTDFPKLDAQMDQQFYLASQQNMVNDLEKLNAELLAARQETLNSNRIRTDLFAVMSHEMRTPLNGVISALSLLEDKNLEENEQLISLAKNSANSLMTVINFALDYSKIDAGRMDLVEEGFEPRKLINSVTSVGKSLASQKGLQFDVIQDDNLPSGLIGDEEKLRQILTNLIGNAIKFTEQGSVTLKVNWNEAGSVSFSVKDTGYGIASEDQKKIFKPFWTSTSGNENIQSTGLGLNIAQQLATLMEGNITVVSEVDIGSKFLVTIPLQAIELQIETEPEVEHIENVKFEGRVLVVDDNHTNLILAEMLLEKLGLNIRKASSGEDAVEIAKDVKFDVILMDILMPGIDGMQATKLINQMPDPPPIVACTANVGTDYARQYLASGFSGYIQKPIDIPRLYEVLDAWLTKVKSNSRQDKIKANTLSTRVLDKLVNDIGGEKFEEFRNLFLSESQKRMTSLLSGWVSRDYKKLVLESHSMASSTAGFGAHELARKLKRIESFARDREVNQLVEEISDLEIFFNAATSAIENYKIGESE